MTRVRKRDRPKEPAEGRAALRCAVYTRKSSDEGLDQEFNSLDAQREAAEAYIASQRAEGWSCLPARYDDGGFSGGSDVRTPPRLSAALSPFGVVWRVLVWCGGGFGAVGVRRTQGNTGVMTGVWSPVP